MTLSRLSDLVDLGGDVLMAAILPVAALVALLAAL